MAVKSSLEVVCISTRGHYCNYRAILCITQTCNKYKKSQLLMFSRGKVATLMLDNSIICKE